MSEGTPEINSSVTDSGFGPLAYRLVLTAILCVSVMFVIVIAMFGFLGVSDEGRTGRRSLASCPGRKRASG